MRIQSSLSLLTAMSALIAFAVAAGPAPAAAETTWDQIKRTGKLRQGVINYPPYWYQDTKDNNKWKGAMIDMGDDVAKELGVAIEFVDTTWATVVLNLQANKTDLQFGLQATPKRATAIDFAGPVYHVGFFAITRKGFKGGPTWADYNKPDVKVAVQMGTSDELIVRKMAPKATRAEFAQISEVVLAVISGRADAFVTAVFNAVVEKSRNPDLGEFIFPTPQVLLPSYAGMRRDDNTEKNADSFSKFMRAWSEWNALMGFNEDRLKKALNVMGVADIPESVHF